MSNHHKDTVKDTVKKIYGSDNETKILSKIGE